MKAARFFRFGTAIAVAALLAVNAFAGNAKAFNKEAKFFEVTRLAEKKAMEMRFELGLNNRKYERVRDFYIREMSRGYGHNGCRISIEREDRAMRSILSNRQYNLWKEIHFHEIMRGGAVRGPAHVPAHGHGKMHNHHF